MSVTPPPVDPYMANNENDELRARERRSGFQFGFDTSDWRNWGLVTAGVFVLIGVVLRIVGATVSASDDPNSASYAVGSIIGGVMCVGVGPVVLIAIARSVRGGGTRRTLMTAAASLALILGALQVLAGGATIYTAQRRQANERARAADANLEAVRIDLAEKNRSGTATPADLERMREATDRVADTLSGKDKALGDSLREFVAHVTEISRPTVVMTQEFTRLGGLSPDSLSDEVTMRQRITLLRDNRATAEKAVRLARALPGKIKEITAGHGVSEKDADVMLRNAIGDGRLEQLVRIREIDAELYPLMAEYLGILSENRDKWELVQGVIQSNDAEFLARFSGLAEKVQTLSKEQMALTEELSRVAGPRR